MVYGLMGNGLCTEMRLILCTWFGEFCSCCSLTALPGPAWVLLNRIGKELISSLYKGPLYIEIQLKVNITNLLRLCRALTWTSITWRMHRTNSIAQYAHRERQAS